MTPSFPEVRRRPLRRLALLSAFVSVTGAALSAASPAAGEPMITLSSAGATLGQVEIVTLTGWPTGPATISVCGNAGARGSADCDLLGAQGAGIANGSAPTIVQLVVGRPPVPCPCVVRAADSSNSVVRTVAISLAGVPTGPVVAPAPLQPLLTVDARVEGGPGSVLDRLRSLLGGPVRRRLVLDVKNLGTKASQEINASASVGRAVNSGDPLAMPALGSIGPGQTKRYVIPLRVSPPSWGRYQVSGTVAGYGVPVHFAASTASKPLLLVPFAFALVLDLALLVGLRLRRPFLARREPRPVPSPALGRGPLAPVDIRRAVERSAPAPSVRAPAPPPRAPAPPARAPAPGPIAATTAAPRPDLEPPLEIVPENAFRPPRAPRPTFFQSRRAAVATLAAVGSLLLVVYLTAKVPAAPRRSIAAAKSPNRSTDQAAGYPPAPPTAAGSQTTTTAPGRGAFGPGQSGSPSQAPTSVAVAPATITVGNTANLKNGASVAVHVVANQGSKIFGFEIRLCAGGAAIRLDSDMRPTLGGNCVTKSLSPGTDFDQIIQTSPPFTNADTVFRVGVGTDQLTTTLGRAVSITCGPGHPCELALKVQYPNGFAFRTYPVTYS